tara:strand:- start:213 stop:920 length:708 start_codon:yes stop_codon:yes gene_type:complete
MGFLDNSTNNIIVDAVLTDYGRELLARNDGSFSIVKFAFGDDEVDYTLIEKFGRTVGKQKIELNTPVFEAQTNQNFALKNKLISLSNPTLFKLPSVTIQASGLVGTNLGFKRNGENATQTIVFTQKLSDENTIEPELRDQTFLVKLPYRFLELGGGETPDSIDSEEIATYILTKDSTTTAAGGSMLTLEIKTRSISDSVFTFFGDADNKSQISTTFAVTGVQSGVVTELSATIEK